VVISKSVSMAFCVLLATAACAQFPGRGDGPDGGRRGLRAPTDRGDAAPSVFAPTPVQLDRLEDDLKLASAQRPAWNAYADRVQKLAETTSRMRFDARTDATGRGTAVEQLERLAADERARTAAIDEIVALGRALYAVLTPEQKALADRRLAGPLLSLVSGMAATTRRDVPRAR
jgi:hypothetical protein